MVIQMKKIFSIVAFLCFLSFVVFGLLLAVGSNVFADDIVDKVSITVPVSCTMSGVGINTHNAEINNGQYDSNIGETTLKAFCNDNDGFAIYAIGYTDNLNGKNVLANTTLGSSYDIATGTAISGDSSNWAMKLTTVSTPVPTYPITIQNSFDAFHVVPDKYTLVAKRVAGTDIGQFAEGSTLKTTYQAYISKTQAAGTYTGQVKYTLIHPSIDVPNVLYMQNVADWGDSVSVGQEVYAVDTRDNTGYTVKRLADGKLWMTQNLRLDLSEYGDQLTMSNTNSPDSTFLAAANNNPISSASWCTTNNAACDNQILFNTSNLGDTTEDQYGNTYDEYGVYYNWYTATAGNGTYDLSLYGDSATGDICPAGWHLPTGGTLENSIGRSDWYYLTYSTIGFAPNSNEAYTGDQVATALSAMRSDPALVFSGGWSGSSARGRGTSGVYWSSTVYDVNYGLRMQLSPTTVRFYGPNEKHYGFAVRCLANDAVTTLADGRSVATKMKTLAAGTQTAVSVSTSDIKAIRMASELPNDFVPSNENTVSVSGSAKPIYIFFDDTNDAGIMYFYSDAEQIVMNADSTGLFFANTALADISGISDWDTSNVVTMPDMFAYDSALTDISSLANWDTSKVVNMTNMFAYDSSLTSIDLSNWDTSSVTKMNIMFTHDTALTSINVSGWDVSNVTNMQGMFKDNGQLTEIIGLDGWDVSNVINMGYLFYGASNMTSYEIADWDVSKVESFNHTFCDNRKLQSLDLSKWDVSSVKTMYDMFDDNYRLTTIGDVSHWNTANLIDVGGWLNGASSFVGNNGVLDLSGWNTSNLKSSQEMFRATKLQTIDLSGWTFDAITNSAWEGAGSGIYNEYGTGMSTMFKDTTQLNVVYVSQSGLNSFNAAVNRGVNMTNMWSGSSISGFTVKP